MHGFHCSWNAQSFKRLPCRSCRICRSDEQAGVARLLPAYRLRKGVDVSSSSQGVCVDLHVVVEQGVNMASVVDNLSASVKFLLRQIAELENVKVTVHIEAMRASR